MGFPNSPPQSLKIMRSTPASFEIFNETPKRPYLHQNTSFESSNDVIRLVVGLSMKLETKHGQKSMS